MKRLVIIMLVLAAGGLGGWKYFDRTREEAPVLKTAPVKRGDLVVTIGATGTVEPEEVIDVGAQVVGRIFEFGKDAQGRQVDYGTSVEEGMVLARIDDALYAAEAGQARAQLEQAKATVIREKADLEQMKARLFQAERNWKRAQELGPSRALSATDFDSYRATFETAKATLAVGEASILQAEKAVMQAEATYKRAETNLSYCTIRSPVKGVIIDRRVNIGQTVVASLNAPSLFLIAKDLSRMQVWVAVNEADIGQIQAGQAVRFTVDAHPDKTFVGKVSKVRLNASMTQNVVNYTVEVVADNSSGKLLPYLTANVLFEVARRDDVLLVPNAALRWSPSSAEMVAPEAREAYAAVLAKKNAPRRGVKPTATQESSARSATVWVQQGAFVKPISVTAGLSDGSNTEVQTDALTDAAQVVVGEAPRGTESNTVNPFAPQMPRGRRGT